MVSSCVVAGRFEVDAEGASLGFISPLDQDVVCYSSTGGGPVEETEMS